MERRLGRTTAGASDPRGLNRGWGPVGLWRAIADLFLWLCMLVPVALFILFMPLLAGMLSTGRMAAGVPDRGATVETSGTALAAVVR